MKVITFGYVHDKPPEEATLVLDCQALPDPVTSSPDAQAILARAREHANPGAVIAFGCGFGQSRSVQLATEFAYEMAARFAVQVEHRGINQLFTIQKGDRR